MRRRPELTVGQAALLGALHGPAELLPISSSAHVALVPWLAGAADGLGLGVGRACALVPGVSRTAATLVAARLRGFDRPDAGRLSRHAALPVIAGAAGLEGLRLARAGLPAGAGAAFAAGTA